MCEKDQACDALMPEYKGVCYKQGLVVKEMYQMCDITKRKILDLLKRGNRGSILRVPHEVQPATFTVRPHGFFDYTDM
jgi:hypothetical protein